MITNQINSAARAAGQTNYEVSPVNHAASPSVIQSDWCVKFIRDGKHVSNEFFNTKENAEKFIARKNAMNAPESILDASSKHTYDVEIARGKYIRIDANTRSQAASRAKKAGFEACSVNMLG